MTREAGGDARSTERALMDAAPACASVSIDSTSVWTRVLELSGEKASLAASVRSLRLVSLSPQRAVVGFTPREKPAATLALEHLKRWFAEALGSPIAVVLQQVEAVAVPRAAPPAAIIAPIPDAPVEVKPVEPARVIDRDAAAAHPLVLRAVELFAGRVTRIEPRKAAIDTTSAEEGDTDV